MTLTVTFMNTCLMEIKLPDLLGKEFILLVDRPNGHNQWGPTVKESGIRNLDGPAAASFYKNFDHETQQSINMTCPTVELISTIRSTV